MNSEIAGTLTSKAEITHISSHGVWLLASDKELSVTRNCLCRTPTFHGLKMRPLAKYSM